MNSEALIGIPARIREMREICEFSYEEMAEKLEISVEEYKKYEAGELDIPVSKIFEMANIFNIDFSVLLTGDGPRMDSYAVTRAGKGLSIARYPGYDFSSLAANFIARKMEPLLVEISSDQPTAPLVSHTGQEFNYCLSGTMRVQVGKKEIILNPGDSIYFDPELPHGQSAIDGTAKFLTVILE
ncbi:MAG: cupin domain-containing protein [Clostridia bacterium]|nr:cupin domain-containing protein [Clostridia bacterium]